MSKSHDELAQIITYMKAHWPSEVKPEWQVGLAEYPAILRRVMSDLTLAATQHHRLIRIAGVSGSGKTTQILPAVEAYCEQSGFEPILIAARRFVAYHPHYQEIKAHYGDVDLRKMTDEFSTIMLFLTLSELIKGGYDVVLDVTLLDPNMEAILLKMIKSHRYDMLILMLAVSPAVTEHYLRGRAWRHSREAEEEFIRATSRALTFYAAQVPDCRIIMWSAYDHLPVYDGPVNGCLDIFADYSSRTTLPASDDDARRDAKIAYLTNLWYTNVMDNVKILAIVGMSGSGKSVAVDYLTAKGYPKVYFGGMIYKEMEKRGIERTPDGETEKNFREQIRNEEGKDWVVRQVIAETKDLIAAGQRRIVLDGVYSWTEYKTLKHEFPKNIIFLAIVVDKKLRYDRVAKRPERAFDGTAIRERDRSEIENLEKGGPIVAADYYILNNGSIADMEADLARVLKEIEFWVRQS